MQRRDSVILKKILSEIQIAFEMLGDTDLDSFLSDEMLKRTSPRTADALIPRFRGTRLPVCAILQRTNIRPYEWRTSTTP